MADFHQVLYDFSNIQANLLICTMFPGSHEGIFIKAKEGEINETGKAFLM